MISAMSPTDAFAALFSDRPPAFLDVRVDEDRLADGVHFPGALQMAATAVSAT